MWRLFIFLVLVMFNVEARLPDNDSLKITEITITIKSRQDKDGVTYFFCNHNDISKQNNKYTVLEGEEFKIITKHNFYVNHLICKDYTNNQRKYTYKSTPFKNVTTFIAEKNMGTLWNCTVLTSRDTSVIRPLVLYEGHTYSAAYCYMQIHVRQTNPPQTILVNNMALQADRTDLSEKNVDFTTVYQYADGDVVNVACVNFLGAANLAIEYPMADTLSDKFTSRNLSSSQTIGFSAKLHSGHNNSYMICTDTGTIDYTKVMVRFVMRTDFNIVSIKINGMTLRPKVYNQEINLYGIEYKYMSNQPIKVVCEVKRADVVLVVTDSVWGFVGEVKGYNKRELIPTKKSEMSFQLNGENKTLACGSDYLEGRRAEIVRIRFSKGNFPIEQYPLHMELPPNGKVMELYDSNNNRPQNVVFYEFEDGERLQLKCGPLLEDDTALTILYLEFKDSICMQNGCYITEDLIVTDQHNHSEIVCRLKSMELIDEDEVLKEIRVIFVKRVPTTTTATTTTTPTTLVTTTTKPTPTNTTSVQHTDHACANNIDSLKIKILEELLKHQQEIHKEQLMFKLKERELKEKMWEIDLKIKENELENTNRHQKNKL